MTLIEHCKERERERERERGGDKREKGRERRQRREGSTRDKEEEVTEWRGRGKPSNVLFQGVFQTCHGTNQGEGTGWGTKSVAMHMYKCKFAFCNSSQLPPE